MARGQEQIGPMTARFCCVLLPIAFSAAPASETGEAHSEFWYEEPAAEWSSAIPLGNGRIGAMTFGGVRDEFILINESSVWAGPPVPADNPRGPALIATMREKLFAGKYAEANTLCRDQFLSPDPGEAERTYKPLGFLRLEHTLGGEPVDYRRWLDYDQSLSEVRFRLDGVTYTREAYISAPDQVLVLHYTASQRGRISFTAGLNRESGALAATVGENSIHFFGQASAGSHYLGTKFDAVVRIIPDGGQARAENGRLRIEGADGATILVGVLTDYNLADPDRPLDEDRFAKCTKQVAAAAAKGYPTLRRDHIADYRSLYDRSALDVRLKPRSALPIDRRIAAAAAGIDDQELLLVYYRYCRYILISASRAGGLAANLQGLWDPLMRPPWGSDYHLNINLQEAYWFAEQGNLSSCHQPLFALTEGLMKHGAETARAMFGCRGFMAAFHTDPWLFTAPTGQPKWGMYVVGGAWCAQHLMEHYRFTQDRDFLKRQAYPVLRDASLFFTDWLVPDPTTGKLVSGPSTSPENSFRTPDGAIASLTMGPTHDQEVIWNTFRDYLVASGILGIENDETRTVRSDLERLALPRIGQDGRLMEWPHPFDEPEPGHRHLSHLWGFMPGNRITLEGTPELAQAVRRSLDYRLSHDYNAQGWSLGWVATIMARLKEGDRALDLMTHQYFAKAFPNMFVNAHGQIQVTDMMGVPLAMIELLLQSHAGAIELLPALPKEWDTGSETGLCARGGFVLDLEWSGGRLEKALVHSRAGGHGRFRYGAKVIELDTQPGQTYPLHF